MGPGSILHKVGQSHGPHQPELRCLHFGLSQAP